MEDLKDEEKTFLINYLDEFNQNLINRTDEVKEFLTGYENLAYEIVIKEVKEEYKKYDANVDEEIKKSKKREKIEVIKDFFELQKLKTFFFNKFHLWS